MVPIIIGISPQNGVQNSVGIVSTGTKSASITNKPVNFDTLIIIFVLCEEEPYRKSDADIHDKTESFGIYFPGNLTHCKLRNVIKWLNLFVDYHKSEVKMIN